MPVPRPACVAVAAACLVALAGCGGFAGDPQPTRETTTARPGTTFHETTGAMSTTPPETTTVTGTPTATTVTYTQGLADELRVSNDRTSAVTLNVTVTARNGTVVAQRTVTVAANGSVGYNVTYPRAGTYEVAVAAGNESASRTYDVAAADPDSRIDVLVLDDGIRVVDVAV